MDSFRAGTRFRGLLAVLGCACLLAGLGVGAASARTHHHKPRHRRANHGLTAPTTQARNRPNIVFVLTDDLSTNLLKFMPHVLAMQRQGMTFKDYFVSDSLCCPSRSSIFTGNFPHDTGIYSNTGKHGGFDQFYARGEAQHTFATALKRAGYRTAMMGKYLNGYMGEKGSRRWRRPRTCRRGGRDGTSPAGAIPSSTTCSTRTADCTAMAISRPIT